MSRRKHRKAESYIYFVSYDEEGRVSGTASIPESLSNKFEFVTKMTRVDEDTFRAAERDLDELAGWTSGED
jgi:hypothetical protein